MDTRIKKMIARGHNSSGFSERTIYVPQYKRIACWMSFKKDGMLCDFTSEIEAKNYIESLKK